VEMHLCEHKRESVGSSSMCLRPRRRHGRARAGAGGWRGAWRLGRRWRDVDRQEQASAGRGNGGAGAMGARHMAGEGGGGRAQRKQRRRELEVDDGD
jgi:hypothetical protein